MIFNLAGYGNNIDLTQITSTEADVKQGKVFVKSNGELAIGELIPVGYTIRNGHEIFCSNVYGTPSSIKKGDFLQYEKSGTHYNAYTLEYQTGSIKACGIATENYSGNGINMLVPFLNA